MRFTCVCGSVLVMPFCGGVAPPILLSAPPTEVQISPRYT